MIRVVIDTNALISALASASRTASPELLLTIAGPAARLRVSGEVYAEYEEVIRRPHFKRSESEIVDTLRAIRKMGAWVKPSDKVRTCSDPDDDVVLEWSQAAYAQYLVTGNLKHFLAKWADTQIVTPHQVLHAIGEIQDEPHEL